MAEIRKVDVEDWEGNKYVPNIETGSASAGATTTAEDIDTNDKPSLPLPDDKKEENTSAGEPTTDPNSTSGMAIIVTNDPNADKLVASVLFDMAKFGHYAVKLRFRASGLSGHGTNSILTVKTYYEDLTHTYNEILLSTTNITGNSIGMYETDYVDPGFITNYRGSSTSSMALRVEVILPKTATNVTIMLDAISIAQAFTALTGSNTTITRL